LQITVSKHWKAKGHQTELEEKVKQLQKEVEFLKQERDILKKAVRIFAAPQP